MPVAMFFVEAKIFVVDTWKLLLYRLLTPVIQQRFCLTHFDPTFHFCTPWKRLKTLVFLRFQGGIEMERCVKWVKSFLNVFCNNFSSSSQVLNNGSHLANWESMFFLLLVELVKSLDTSVEYIFTYFQTTFHDLSPPPLPDTTHGICW